MMALTLSQIKDICYFVLFAFSVLGWWKASMSDGEERVKEFTKVNWKLDAVCQSQNDIKDDVRGLKTSSANTDNKITRIEEQIKVANHRIDDLERKVGL